MRSLPFVMSGAALGSAVVAVAAARSRPAPAESRAWEPAFDRLERDLEAMSARLGSLEGRLDAEPPRSPEAAEPPRHERPVPTPPKDEGLDGAVARLLDRGAPRDEAESLFDGMRRAKTQAALVRSLEARTASGPRDAKAHYLLARALIEQLMVEPSYVAKEELGNRALAEYDKAIAIDPAFWEPRYEKAESLTYYPESLGMTPDAIREVEVLLAIQGGSSHDPRFAGTYSHLGRLYLRIGKAESAEAVVREGARLFPDHEDLRKQLELFSRR